MKYLVSISLILVGVIHLLPLSGVLSSEHLFALYGLPFVEPNLEILMRHRAVLFGLLGGFLILAAFKPALQGLALSAGFISVASSVYLAYSVGDYNAQIHRVVLADLIAMVLLFIGLVAYIRQGKRS